MTRAAEHREAGEALIRECCAELGDDLRAVEIWWLVDHYQVRRSSGRIMLVNRKGVDDKDKAAVKRDLEHHERPKG